MSLIFSLGEILEESRAAYLQIKEGSRDGAAFYPVEEICSRNEPPCGDSLLARGDNLDFMQYLIKEKGLEGKLQLIYVDPPFYSKASYDAVIKLKSDKVGEVPAIKPVAYDDVWKTGIREYLKMLSVRFFLMRDLLCEKGCFWVHLDWHVVHYVKLLLDEIFGEKNFVNEVVWTYKSGGTGKRNFSRKHDTLLFYGKSKDYFFHPLKEKSYNRGYKPYHFKGVEEYKDEIGWYTLVNMKDVWQIDMVGRTSGERTGYATQKPEELLRRIIQSCSQEGDLCADFFGGSGTLAAAARELGRKWISCDIGGIAAASCMKRMSIKNSSFTFLEQHADSHGDELNIKVETEPIPFTDKLLMIVTLLDYQMDTRKMPLRGKDGDILQRFRREDPLQLLEYWSVDFSYDGRVHRPQFSFPKKQDRIETSCRQIVGKAETVSIRTMDVFGNSTLKILEF